MNTFKLLSTNTSGLLILLLTTLLFTACSDNPASSEDEHTDPKGLELVHDGEVVYEYLNGSLTEHSHLHFHAGEGYPFEVHFLNENGEHVHSEDLGEGYSLGWEVENENVLEIHQHEEDTKWTFHLKGISEGGSKVQFKLDHGDHSHLETPPVTQDGAIEFHVDGQDGEHNHSLDH